ncbi:MFS transporter [Alkalihalobacterium chitinilyticum]|uniref:MFS transporter n=1 Tax=Alkalihalobacterium chitinilyticum TaxID=2980103 RepID=A0ABT5V8N8_9BACI|nr:MFS transporter [Alkalihalobacterium chitinilyticum]MDE5411829.1 MFS transporter [Alkalihalobacterium chitinilyticum]
MNPYKILWLLSIAQFLAMQVWFNFSAVLPVVESEWGLTSTQSGVIIACFHLGYVIAILFYSFMSDKYDPKQSFVYGALIAGTAGILLSFFAQGFWSTLILRTISGIGIAGIYVPGMRIISQLFPSYERGKALGVFVGSLVVGSGFSLLISGLFIEMIGWQGVVFITSTFCLIASLIAFFVKVPPMPSGNGSAFDLKKIKNVFKKPNLLVNGGYAGHCWELYAMWAWIGPFLVYYFLQQGFEQEAAIRFGNIAGALVIMIGGIATYIGGRVSDAIGRVRAATFFLLISIFCSIAIGWSVQLPIILMLLLAVVYGFTIVADSPIYNVSITEVSDPDVIALALGVQSVLGFTVTIFSPIVFGYFLDQFNWGMAFTVIGIVTIIAPICMLLLGRIQHTTKLHQGN